MKKCLNIIRVLVFVLLLLLVYTKATDVLIKKEHKNNTVADFYKEPSNSVDVVFLGTSHAYQAFSPMEFWKEEGISSYNLATSSQPMAASYYLLKEAIRTQHPKVAVVEVHGVKYEEDYFSKARLHVAVDGIPLNRTKAEMCREFLSRTMNFGEQLEYIFPISLYHTRWEELKKRDFKPTEPYTKGFLLISDQQELQYPQILNEKADWEMIHDSVRIYIDQIITLCQENNVELVFCQVPMGNDEEYKNVQLKVNTILDYAEAKGVTCINFQRMLDQIGIDFTKDFVNEGHLNILGAQKINDYLIGFLKERYQLTDHREDKKYASWEDAYKKYAKRKKKLLKEIES